MQSLRRLPPHLRHYCIYTGRTLPQSALSKEHVIPKSLGRNSSTVIWVDRKTNSDFGSTIDGKIEKDPMVSFGRRDAHARGHNKKVPAPQWKNAVRWRPGEPIGTGEGSYTLQFPESSATSFDNRNREYVPVAGSDGRALVVWRMGIDHIARLKFTLKTLLGLGWKLFQTGVLDALDCDFIRGILVSPIRLTEGVHEGGLSFTDGFIDKSEEARARDRRLQDAFVRKLKTTVLLRQEEGRLNWSIACLGYFVGSVWLPLKTDSVAGELARGDALRLTFGAQAFEADVVPRHLLMA